MFKFKLNFLKQTESRKIYQIINCFY